MARLIGRARSGAPRSQEGARSPVAERCPCSWSRGESVDPAVIFATEKERIVEALRQKKAEELHAQTLAEMKEKARIVYSR
jgi:hypothetical protein